MAQPHNIRPPFPPNFTVQELTNVKGKHLKGFHMYRIACIMVMNAQSIPLSFTEMSNIASHYWTQESRDVKETYRFIANEFMRYYKCYKCYKNMTFFDY